MRQRRWLELIKDYNCTILYHPRNANVVVDALSWKSSGDLVCVMAHLRIYPMLNDKIKATQSSDLQIQKIIEEVKKGQKTNFAIKGDDSLGYSKRLGVLNDSKLRRDYGTSS